MADVFDVASKAVSSEQQVLNDGAARGGAAAERSMKYEKQETDKSVQLAQLAMEQDKTKQALAAQKEALIEQKWKNVSGRLNTIMRSSDTVAGALLKQFEKHANEMDMPLDPEIGKAILKDPDFKNRFRTALKAVDSASNPAAKEEAMQALSSMGLTVEGFQMIENAEKRGQDMKMQQSKIAADRSMKVEEQVGEKAEKFTQKMQSEGITDTIDGLSQVDAYMRSKDKDGGIYGKGNKKMLSEATGWKNISLMGVKPFQSFIKDKEFIQKTANVANTFLRSKAGAAVTDSESRRIVEQMGNGVLNSPEDLRKGLQIISQSMENQAKGLESGFRASAAGKEAIKRVAQEGGVTSERVPQAGQAPRKQVASSAPKALDKAGYEKILSAYGGDESKAQNYMKSRNLTLGE